VARHARGAPGTLVLQAGAGIGPGAARRLLDIVLAGSALLLLWPLLLFVAAGALASTGGSPIYRQLRVGQGGVAFTLLKFRTMRARSAGPEVTAPGDPRVTRFGALLRRTGIDELPQLVNVLLGKMTLVGPRPESVALAVRYPPQYWFVFRYRPGLTGPSQVLEHDDHVLRQAGDAEEFYLRDLVPRRIATDLTFLERPTLARTLRWLANTARYLAGPGVPAAALRDGGPLSDGGALPGGGSLREGGDLAEPWAAGRPGGGDRAGAGGYLVGPGERVRSHGVGGQGGPA
jgi:lipopolysaccharide/colanic/teichoic acid biosynthesis glycosyltransferase